MKLNLCHCSPVEFMKAKAIQFLVYVDPGGFVGGVCGRDEKIFFRRRQRHFDALL